MAARMKAGKKTAFLEKIILKADRAIYPSLVATGAYGIPRALNAASGTQITEAACFYL